MNIRNLCLMLVAILLCGCTQAAEIPDSEWTVEVTPAAGNKLKGTTKPYTDVYSFKAGKFSSDTAAKQGFAAGAYEIKTEKGITKISADMSNEKHGKNQYELEIKDGMLVGTLKWGKTGEDGKPKTAATRAPRCHSIGLAS